MGGINFACNDNGTWNDLKAVNGSLKADSIWHQIILEEFTIRYLIEIASIHQNLHRTSKKTHLSIEKYVLKTWSSSAPYRINYNRVSVDCYIFWDIKL